jgi:Ca2+/Na+ antiporter
MESIEIILFRGIITIVAIVGVTFFIVGNFRFFQKVYRYYFKLDSNEFKTTEFELSVGFLTLAFILFFIIGWLTTFIW